MSITFIGHILFCHPLGMREEGILLSVGVATITTNLLVYTDKCVYKYYLFMGLGRKNTSQVSLECHRRQLRGAKVEGWKSSPSKFYTVKKLSCLSSVERHTGSYQMHND